MSNKESAIAARTLARRYHALGINVLPLDAHKHPMTTGTASNGKPYKFSWDAWQQQRQTANVLADILKPRYWIDVAGVGAICGPVSDHLACIDFDMPTKRRGQFPPELLTRFLDLAGLPSDYGWTVDTPRGGYHVWLRAPALEIDKGKLDAPAAGLPDGFHVEVRYTGHYAALPGSICDMSDTKPMDGYTGPLPPMAAYVWRNGEPDVPPAVIDAAALLSAWAAVTVAKPAKSPAKAASTATATATASTATHRGGTRRAAVALAAEVANVRSAVEGTRSDTLNAAAFNLGQLAGLGELDAGEVESALLDAALAAGLGEGEALRTIRSGATAGAGKSHERTAPRAESGEGGARYNGFGAAPADDDAPAPERNAGKAATGKAQDTDKDLLSERIEDDLVKWGYSFKTNDLDDAIWCNGAPMTDALAAEIRATARDHGYGGPGVKTDPPTPPPPSLAAMEDVYTALASRNRFHPIRDYLTGLQWDGRDRFRDLVNCLSCPQDNIVYPDGSQRLWASIALYRWLQAAIAKVMTKGKVQSPMLVLSGGQGIGKSTLARWLCPLPEYFVEAPIDPDSKDDQFVLTRRFIWEVSELGATTRRKDRESLKAFLTKQEVTARKPYGRYEITKPALCSFVGTVNSVGGFLSDPSGARRFVVLELASIDLAYQTIDRDQLWAQMMADYRKHPEHWRMHPTEIDAQRSAAEAAAVDYPFEHVLTALYEFDAAQAGADWFTPTGEVVTALQSADVVWNEGQHGTLAGTLTALGAKRIQRRIGDKVLRGWQGVRRKGAQIPAEDLGL